MPKCLSSMPLMVVGFVAFPLMTGLADDSISSATAVEELPTKNGSKTKSDVSEAAAEWKPKLQITLLTTPDGQATSVSMPVVAGRTERVKTLQYGFSGFVSEQFVNMPIREIRQVTVQHPPFAQLYVDEVSVNISMGDENKSQYNLKCEGRAYLLAVGLRIDCDSLELAGTEMTMTNARIEQHGRSLKSDSLTLSLEVFGINTSKFDKPLTEAQFLPAGHAAEKQNIPSRALRPEPDRFFRDDGDEARFPGRSIDDNELRSRQFGGYGEVHHRSKTTKPVPKGSSDFNDS